MEEGKAGSFFHGVVEVKEAKKAEEGKKKEDAFDFEERGSKEGEAETNDEGEKPARNIGQDNAAGGQDFSDIERSHRAYRESKSNQKDDNAKRGEEVKGENSANRNRKQRNNAE